MFGWFRSQIKRVTDTGTPIRGIFTFFYPPYNICMRDTRIEVEIVEVLDNYYRIKPVQIVRLCHNPRVFNYINEMPSLVHHREIEIIKRVEPTLVEDVKEEVKVERRIKLS